MRRGHAGARAVLPLVLGIAACDAAPPPPVVEPGICAAPKRWASLPDRVAETSGVAASRRHAGVFWTHNDSGGDSVVFAIDSAGAVVGSVRVRGATNRDWEDIDLAPCDPGSDGDCLFIADIGDNRERHARVAVYRIREPDPWRDTTARADRLRATYPDGAQDAEAVFVNERGIHIVTKGRSQAVRLLRLAPPYRPGRTAALEAVQQLAPPPTSVSAQVTAAAASGDRVVLRTYASLWFFAVDGDTLRPLGDPAWLGELGQMVGEGVDFLPDGRLVLTGEASRGAPASIGAVRCEVPPGSSFSP